MKNKILTIATLTLLLGCQGVDRQVKCGTNKFGTSVTNVVGEVSRQIVNEQKNSACTESNGRTIFFANVIPQTIYQGNKVVATICYPVNIPWGEKIIVSEKREIVMPDGTRGLLSEEVFNRDKGYWNSDYTFEVPKDTNPGNYQVIQTVAYGQVEFSKSFDLEVRETYEECY